MGGGARCMAVEVTNDVIECENARPKGLLKLLNLAYLSTW